MKVSERKYKDAEEDYANALRSRTAIKPIYYFMFKAIYHLLECIILRQEGL